MKRLFFAVFAVLLLLAGGLPAGTPSAQASTEISGTVVSPIDPFLLLRNVARYDPDAFRDIFELFIEQALNPEQQTLLNIALGLAGVSPDEPEAFIDFLEELTDRLNLRPILAEFLVIETDTIIALIPDLPPALRTLLTSLLPETFDLNYLPLAGARMLAFGARGAVVGWTASSLNGNYRLVLPPTAVRLRVTRAGYQPLEIDISDIHSAVPATLNMAEAFPGLVMMTPNPGTLTAIVVQGARNLPVRNALVKVTTADDEPGALTNWLGTTSIKGVKPLLPGLLGGLGFHNVLVDAEDYYLEELRALFLSSNAFLRINLTEAPPFGTLLGRATVRTLFGEVGYGNVAIEVLDSGGNPLNPAVQATSAGNGSYAIPDTVPKGTWQVRFTNPRGTGSIVKDGVEIRAARETEANACFSSLNGSFGQLFRGTTTARSVVIRDATTNAIVGSAASSGNIRFFFYEILGIPPGTYKVEFVREGTTIAYTENSYTFAGCQVRSLSKGN